MWSEERPHPGLYRSPHNDSAATTLLQIGQVSRGPFTARSATAAPDAVWNNCGQPEPAKPMSMGRLLRAVRVLDRSDCETRISDPGRQVAVGLSLQFANLQGEFPKMQRGPSISS